MSTSQAGDLGRAIPLLQQNLTDTERLLGPAHLDQHTATAAWVADADRNRPTTHGRNLTIQPGRRNRGPKVEEPAPAGSPATPGHRLHTHASPMRRNHRLRVNFRGSGLSGPWGQSSVHRGGSPTVANLCAASTFLQGVAL